jgi:hypothetical protein
MVVCTCICSNGRGQAEMTFESQNTQISFVVNIGVDTVECILKEIQENYFNLFHQSPSNTDMVLWRRKLDQCIPKQVGRFRVFCKDPDLLI